MTWTFKFALTDFNPLIAGEPTVVTDGTDLFWMDGTSAVQDNSIYKYDVSASTSTKLVDQSEFYLGIASAAGAKDIATPVMQIFRKELYVGAAFAGGALTTTLADDLAKVFKVDTVTGATTTVVSSFPRTTLQQTGDDDCWVGPRIKLYATESIITAILTENEGSAPIPAECVGVDTELIAMHAQDGTDWVNSTISVSEVIKQTGPGATQPLFAQGRDFRILGIYDFFEVKGEATNVILKFETDTWSKVVGPTPDAGPPASLFEVGHVHFWTTDSFDEFTDDFVTFNVPSLGIAQGPPNVGLNMPFSTTYSNAPINKTLRLDPDDFTANLDIWLRLAIGETYTGGADAFSTLIRLNNGKVLMVSLTSNASATHWSVYESSIDLTATPNAWGGAGAETEAPDSNRPCDINADGTFLYIGAIDTVTTAPVLLKQETGLTQNATRTYDPMAGTDIGVMCGRFDTDVVWAAGAFGGTDVVVKTEDAGTTFTVKDPATFGSVTGFAVGPDSDDRVLLVDTFATIQETENSGTDWTEINASTGAPTTRAIGRLDINVEESVFGSDAGNIAYSPNSGENLEDISSGFAETAIYTGKNVTSIVVN